MFNLLKIIFKDVNEKKIEKLQPIVAKINQYEKEFEKLRDEELKEKTAFFKTRLADGETLDDILPEAFAVVREASKRTIKLRHFDVQLIGGIILHQGKIAEMKTGEGKTLAATLSAYLNALENKGVHIVTVNDYLAKRDRFWMGPIYEFLGLNVGFIQHDMNYQERKLAYNADITYGTNNEFGFDYLRDNMSVSIDQCAQKNLNYAIVDEVDSILIDEARTPLIISGAVRDTTETFHQVIRTARSLKLNNDFTLDEKTKNAVLTEEGIEKAEKMLNITSLFDLNNMDYAHMLLQSIKALYLFKRDVDYVIKDGEVIIVDEFTGRLMIGRRYSDGLHQAIEAKEAVKIKEESQTLATITFQNYFRMYKKIAGMTGTAMTEEAEFGKIYNLEVMTVPTHKIMIRQDYSDVIYKSKKEKYNAVVTEIEQWYRQGRPVLVGTIAIQTSELLSDMLRRRNIPHNVLNAKYHEMEAQIIARAGQKGTVTIATNMAGRGTDIVLGDGVVELGGLHIIGTERHESRRIDNQLRGRCGRQGDPGSSKFYICLEDDLMRLFGSDRIAKMMERLGIPDDTPIEHNLITNSIERAQKKVEEYHFSIRKQVLEYDDVMNRQRESIYSLRQKILKGEDIKPKVEEIIFSISNTLVSQYSDNKNIDEEKIDAIKENIIAINPKFSPQSLLYLDEINLTSNLAEALKELFLNAYNERENLIGEKQMRELERIILLRVIDEKWIDHLHNIDILREGIGLRAYGQRDPLIEYKIEGYKIFQEMMHSINFDFLQFIFKVEIIQEPPKLIRSYPTNIVEKGAELKTGSFTNAVEPVAVSKEPARSSQKVGRNDPCPCGSGKKYKKCCGKTVI